MDIVKVTFNDKTIHEYKKGTLFYDISKDYNMDNIVGLKIGNEVYSLDKEVTEDTKVTFINTSDVIGNKIYKSGLKFIFQVALKLTFPDLEIKYEHSVPRGMLGEVVGDRILTHEDISVIKSKMSEIIASNEKIERLNVAPKGAIKRYLQDREYEKAYNIQNISDKVINLYRLHGLINYFYSQMPYSTGAITKFELVYLGKNRIVFLFPTVASNGRVLEYVHYDKILESFLNGKMWLTKMHMPYITDLNRIVGTRQIRNFIESSELTFTMNIGKVVEEIAEHPDVKFILIAGPSSSGKTTTTSRIATHLEALGYNPIELSLDDYYIDRLKNPKDEFGNYDFECLEALQVDLFNRNLADLLAGKEVTPPKYNFITGISERSKRKLRMTENSIFLIEGLHALNDKLTAAIDDKYKYKIYLSPFIPINIDRHNYVSTLDLRLLRRIVRDNRTRGYKVDQTIKGWQNVRRGEEKNIFPYIHQADTIINTALAYEVGVLKVYAEPLLLSVNVDSEFYAEARRLIDFLKQFFPIPGEYVNNDSILREFIGGNNYD